MEWLGPLTILSATVIILIVNGLAHPAYELHMLIIFDNLGTTLQKILLSLFKKIQDSLMCQKDSFLSL